MDKSTYTNGHLLELIEGQTDRLSKIEDLFAKLVDSTSNISIEVRGVSTELKLMRSDLLQAATGIPRETFEKALQSNHQAHMTLVKTACALCAALVMWFTGAKYLLGDFINDSRNPKAVATAFP